MWRFWVLADEGVAGTCGQVDEVLIDAGAGLDSKVGISIDGFVEHVQIIDSSSVVKRCYMKNPP